MMINKIIDYLDYLFPNPKCELEYNKDYELLLNLIATKAPQMIKDLVEWKKKQMRDSIDYLNNLDFSLPNNKTKHYIVTIKIEEVED